MVIRRVEREAQGNVIVRHERARIVPNHLVAAADLNGSLPRFALVRRGGRCAIHLPGVIHVRGVKQIGGEHAGDFSRADWLDGVAQPELLLRGGRGRNFRCGSQGFSKAVFVGDIRINMIETGGHWG